MGMQDENALVLFIPVYLGSVRLCFVMDGSCYSCLGVSENKEQVQISYCFICCIHDRGPFEHSTFCLLFYFIFFCIEHVWLHAQEGQLVSKLQ